MRQGAFKEPENATQVQHLRTEKARVARRRVLLVLEYFSTKQIENRLSEYVCVHGYLREFTGSPFIEY